MVLYEKSATFFVFLMKTLDFCKKEIIITTSWKEIMMFLYMSKQAKSKKMIGSVSPVVVVWCV